jgi:hypothetical protein
MAINTTLFAFNAGLYLTADNKTAAIGSGLAAGCFFIATFKELNDAHRGVDTLSKNINPKSHE